MEAAFPGVLCRPPAAYLHTPRSLRHSAPLVCRETMTGSTLAGPPLYLPIHPRFLHWAWVTALGEPRGFSSSGYGGLGVEAGRHGSVWAEAEREREKSLIRRPSAARRLRLQGQTDLWSVWAVSPLWHAGSSYVRSKLVPDQQHAR